MKIPDFTSIYYIPKPMEYLKYMILMGILLIGSSATLPTDLVSAPTVDSLDKSPCILVNDAYDVGEEIYYDIYYKAAFVWIKAGRVTFKITDLGDAYKIVAKGTTLPFYDKFYTVRDHYETHIDKETLLPSYFVRDINEGDYQMYDRIEFDHKTRTAHTTRRHRDKETVMQGDYDDCVQDMLSILYYVRSLEMDDYEVGDRIPIHVFHENRTYDLGINYTGYDSRKKIKGKGRVEAFEIRPDLIKNYIISDDHNMSIWVGDDENKIPLEIQAKLTVGQMRAVLSDVKGLRHESKYEWIEE